MIVNHENSSIILLNNSNAMKKLIVPIIAALLICAACSKKENEITLRVGLNSEDVSIHTLNPAMQIEYGHPDSIDFDGDLNYDLLIFQTQKPVSAGFIAETWIAGRNQIKVVLSDINAYPDTLVYGSEISNGSHWVVANGNDLILHGVELYSGNSYTLIGNFLGFTEHYLGVCVGSRFGWLKVKRNAENGKMEVLEWAIMI
jgi:hypothetical protein